MSESNRVSLRYIEENVWGTLPDTPTMQALRHTNQSLSHNIGSQGSNEIRADRNTADSTPTNKQSGGGFDFELSPGTFDDLILGALCNDAWADITTTAYTTLTKTVGDLAVPTSPNGYYYEVTSTTGDGGPASEPTWPTTYGATVVDGEVTWTCRGPVSASTSGTTKVKFSIEKAFLDINQFMLYTGMIVNQFNLNISANSPITGSFDFMGKIPSTALAQTTFCTGTGGTGGTGVTDATSTTVFNAIGNVGTLYENGSALSNIYLQEVSFSINNNLRASPAISYDSAVNVNLGSCEVTGNISAYFADNSLYDKFLASTATSLVVPVSNSEGAYLFVFPRIRLETDQDNGGAINTDIMEQIGFRCLYDSTTDAQIRIHKYLAS